MVLQLFDMQLLLHVLSSCAKLEACIYYLLGLYLLLTLTEFLGYKEALIICN